MRLNRVVVSWAGPQIAGAAQTVLHFQASDSAAPNVAGLVTAFTTLAPAIPTGVTITVPGTGDQIEDTTGILEDVWTAPGGSTISCSGSASAAAGVGACVGWITGGIVAGRRLRGRTFVVPLTSTAYDTTGTITTPALGTITDFANQIIAAGGFGVWHRPTAPGAADGNSYGVLSARIRDKVAYLGTRRD